MNYITHVQLGYKWDGNPDRIRVPVDPTRSECEAFEQAVTRLKMVLIGRTLDMKPWAECYDRKVVSKARYCTCETPVMDVEHDAGCRRCGLPVDFSPSTENLSGQELAWQERAES
jgi:hypothetical protein